MTIGKIPDPNFDGATLRFLWVPAIPLNVVCPLVGNVCYYNNFQLYGECKSPREINTLYTAETKTNITYNIFTTNIARHCKILMVLNKTKKVHGSGTILAAIIPTRTVYGVTRCQIALLQSG